MKPAMTNPDFSALALYDALMDQLSTLPPQSMERGAIMEKRRGLLIGLLQETAARYSRGGMDEEGTERAEQILQRCGAFSIPVRQVMLKSAFANYERLDTLVFSRLSPESWKILREGLDLQRLAPVLLKKDEDDIAPFLMLRFPDRRGGRREVLAYLKGLDSRKGRDVAVRMDYLRPCFEPWKLPLTVGDKRGC